MNAPSERMAFSRHPWLKRFESSPEEAFGDLLAGYAEIHPYERADAPDAARMLFGPLEPEDKARKALGSAILAWLEKQRKQPLPAARPKLQRRVREISEAFEIVALLNVTKAAVELRHHRLFWNNWVSRLVLSPARDARAEYWRMLALTQSLVADSALDIDANGLAPMWRDICREAGSRLPRHYLSIGLLGLRRLPSVSDPAQLPWVAGLAQWALAQHPSDSEFKAEWLALKSLYPRTPQNWRRLVAKLLSATTFKDAEIEPPAWWHVDKDFASMVQGTFQSSDAPLRSPLPRDCDRVISKLDETFEDVEPLIDDLLGGHRKYLYATGDAQYFVRAIHALARELIERGGDNPHARAQRAQMLAREGLKWQPHDPFLWSLWRDALESDGAVDAAELVGWEMIRRDATDAEARNQLAELLIRSDRLSDAASIIQEAFDRAVTDAASYALRARLYSHANKLEKAEATIRTGIDLFPSDDVLKEMQNRLADGKTLPLKSRASLRSRRPLQAQATITERSDSELAGVMQLGAMRQLRFRLESKPIEGREKALEELKRVLREDPTFAYAELLAARHRIWKLNADTLPSFAAAFEYALATEDGEKLEQLSRRQPRLEALILVARALLGDAEAQGKVEVWLREPEIADKEPSILGLHSALRPLLHVIEDGLSVKDALLETHETVLSVLHDANEASIGGATLAA